MNGSYTESPVDGVNTSENFSTTVTSFPYDSIEAFYQHQLPGIIALNRYFTIVWYVADYFKNSSI